MNEETMNEERMWFIWIVFLAVDLIPIEVEERSLGLGCTYIPVYRVQS
jgi:hypothetical protein